MSRLTVVPFVAAIACFAAPRSGSLPPHFESSGTAYTARVQGGTVVIHPAWFGLAGDADPAAVTLRWAGTRGGTLTGEKPTGGVTRHVHGSDPSKWDSPIAHFGQIRDAGLYPGIDAVFYTRESAIEFDLELAPGADHRSLALELSGHVSVEIAEDGALVMSAGGRQIRARKPVARQDGGLVDCAFRLRGNRIHFELGEYDPSRPLIIDPVVEFATYYGSTGHDRIQAVAADVSGNPVVAGLTVIQSKPGSPVPADNTASVFVTKFNASGTAILFTTLLGHVPNVSATSIPTLFSVSALDVDRDGSIYVVGQNLRSSDFPVSPEAWGKEMRTGFLVKLDAAGNVVYSTYLGPSAWGLNPYAVRARNGQAYVAGTVQAAEFLGTPGAFQRGVAGDSDVFVAAVNANGSAPVFATAFGGAKYEFPAGIAVETDGTVTITGSTYSADLPRTAGASPVTPNVTSANAFYARIGDNGSTLRYSTLLGTATVGAPVLLADGDIAINGSPAPPPEFIGAAASRSIRMSESQGTAFVAKMSVATNRPVWVTQLQISQNARGGPMAVDSDGILTFVTPVDVRSGGAYTLNGASSIVSLSADGGTLLFASPIPVYDRVSITTAPGNSIYLAGYWPSQMYPTKLPGGLQPVSAGGDEGTLIKFNLAPVRSGNVFARASTAFSFKWRLDEPAPAALTAPVYLTGDVVSAAASTSSGLLAATFEPGAAPSVQIMLGPEARTSGRFTEFASLQPVGNAEAEVRIPVSIEILPRVSFEVAQTELELRYRVGQARQMSKIGITADFGGEYFTIEAASPADWLRTYVSRLDASHYTLEVNVYDRPAGTYEGLITLRLPGITSVTRTVRVRYIVEPAATFSVSTTNLTLKVTKGQPVTPAIVRVTSTAPGSTFSVFVGMYPVWFRMETSGPATPGEIRVSADADAAQPGVYDVSMYVSGESGDRITVFVRIEVGTGAAIDVTPAKVDVYWQRGSSQAVPYITLSVVTRDGGMVRSVADQPWISPQQDTAWAVPAKIFFSLKPDGLSEGVHTATITLTAGTTVVKVPVSWELYDIPRLVFSKNPLRFKYQIGEPSPAAQEIEITSPTAKPGYFEIGQSLYPGYLKTDPSYGPTPAKVKVTVLTDRLSVGTFETSLIVRSQYPTASSYDTIPVTIEVLADPNAPTAVLTRVANAATFLSGVVSPGEIVTLFGTGIGPANLAVAQPGEDGRFPTSYAGIRVFFDDLAAPVIYASATQTSVVAPYAIAGKAETKVSVEAGGRRSSPLGVRVTPANPGVFTAASSGSGQVAALPGDPVGPGDIVTLFVTGLGTTTPRLTDGAPSPLPLAKLDATVRVLVGGKEAEVLYAGPAPLLIAGLSQINFRVPANTTSGDAALLVLANGEPSQPGVTLRIR